MASPLTLQLRAEQKPLEHRSALTPTTAKALIDSGYTVLVERSPSDPNYKRVFEDQEFENIGAKLVDTYCWPDASDDTVIVGLKELPEEPAFPLKHTHVQFAHCYKNQGGWQNVLARFPRGGGTLYDLEFLQIGGRRVAAFGYHAGFAGAALAVKTWAWQLTHSKEEPLPSVYEYTEGRGYYENENQLIEQLKVDLKKGQEASGRLPTALVIGALGRCGRGAVDLFTKIGVPEGNLLKWDLAETSGKPGPYKEIVESDIFVNCIYLSDPIPPFVNKESLSSSSRKLSVICDVSCDTTNPHNPIPVYNINTTFDKPTVPVPGFEDIQVISIDHLPSLLPREASEAFSNDLLPYLKELKNRDTNQVWADAKKLFDQKVSTLPENMQKKEL